jgi:hypothetical protein
MSCSRFCGRSLFSVLGFVKFVVLSIRATRLLFVGLESWGQASVLPEPVLERSVEQHLSCLPGDPSLPSLLCVLLPPVLCIGAAPGHSLHRARAVSRQAVLLSLCVRLSSAHGEQHHCLRSFFGGEQALRPSLSLRSCSFAAWAPHLCFPRIQAPIRAHPEPVHA